MRLGGAVGLLLGSQVLACVRGPSRLVDGCGDSHLPIPTAVPQIRRGAVLDSVTARAGVAQLVFHLRSVGPGNRNDPLPDAQIELLRFAGDDSRVFGRLSDSVGAARFDSVPPIVVGARVRRLGYGNHAFDLTIRPGYTDTIELALSNVACILPARGPSSSHRLQN